MPDHDSPDLQELISFLAAYGFGYFSTPEGLDRYRRTAFGRHYDKFFRLQETMPSEGAIDPRLSKRFDEFAFREPNVVAANSAWSDDVAAGLWAMTQAIGDSKRVLDIGCGGGHIANWFASLDQHREVVGVDVSQCALAFARRRASALSLSNVRFDFADIERGIPAGPFDAVLESATFYVLQDPLKVLAHVSAALSPDGRLISTPMIGRAREIESFLADLQEVGLGVRSFGWVCSSDLGSNKARPIIVAARKGDLVVDVGAEMAEVTERLRGGRVRPLWSSDLAN